MAEQYVVYVAEPGEVPSTAARQRLSEHLKLDDAKLDALLKRLPAEVTRPVPEATALTVARRFREAGLEAFIRPWKDPQARREANSEANSRANRKANEGAESGRRPDAPAHRSQVSGEGVPPARRRSEPSAAEPASPDPAPADPATREPATPDPATREPAPEERATRGPATGDLARGDGATREPSTGDPDVASAAREPHEAGGAGEEGTATDRPIVLPSPQPTRQRRPDASLGARDADRVSGFEGDEDWRVQWSRPAQDRAETRSVHETEPVPRPDRQRRDEPVQGPKEPAVTAEAPRRRPEREPEVEVFTEPEPATKAPSKPLLFALILVLAVFLAVWLLL